MIVKKLGKNCRKIKFQKLHSHKGEGNNLHDKKHGCIKYLNCLPQENECDGKKKQGSFIVSHRLYKCDFKISKNAIIVPLGASLLAKS
jgi:hypothetical protein